MVNQMVKIPKGCVLWLDLTEDTGDIVYDRSGHGNNGRVYGAVLEKRLPYVGRRFDGVDDYAVVSDSPSLRCETNNKLTVLAWVKLEYFDAPRIENFVLRKSTDWNNGWGLSWFKDDDTIGFRLVFTDGTNVVLKTKRPDDWVFIGGTYDGSKAYLYKNAKIVATQKPNKTLEDTTGYPVYISKSDRLIKGFVAHVSIYNRALSPREIKYLYEEFQKRVFRRIEPLEIRMR